MKVCVLGSGSKGNCTLVQSKKTTILIDAGFSGVEINRRLEPSGFSPDEISGLLITHEHNDHISGAGVMSRRVKVPVYANPATHRAAEKRVGKLFSRKEFNTGESFSIRDLEIHPFSISHDTAEPVGYVITDGIFRVGYCTDTGKVTALIEHHLRQCDILVLESNHDPKMLRNGPYPLPLQQRVRSNQGHLANEDAGKLLKKLANGKLKHVVLAHLSEVNNLPELALHTAEEHLGQNAECIEIVPASQDNPCRVITLS